MANTLMDFVQNLFPSLGQVSKPMFTSPFTDPDAYRASPEAAAYYADPFRKQSAINQAILDEALKQKEAETVQGMLSAGGEMSDTGLNPYVAAYLDAGGGDAGMQAQKAMQYQALIQAPSIVKSVMNTINPGMLGGLQAAYNAQQAQMAQQGSGARYGLASTNPIDMAALTQQAADDLAAYQAYSASNDGGGDSVGSVGGVSLGGGDPGGYGYGTAGF